MQYNKIAFLTLLLTFVFIIGCGSQTEQLTKEGTVKELRLHTTEGWNSRTFFYITWEDGSLSYCHPYEMKNYDNLAPGMFVRVYRVDPGLDPTYYRWEEVAQSN